MPSIRIVDIFTFIISFLMLFFVFTDYDYIFRAFVLLAVFGFVLRTYLSLQSSEDKSQTSGDGP